MALFKGKKPESSRRTPTTSGRSTVFSYYSQSTGRSTNAPNETRRLQPTESISLGGDRHKTLIANAPLIIAVAVLVICTIYNTTLSTDAQVITNSVTSEKAAFLRSKQAYQDGVDAAMRQSVLSRSKLTIDTQSIADDLTRQFPELADVSVSLPLIGRRPVVQLQATKPALVLISGERAYILDHRGIVLMDSKDYDGESKSLFVVNDQSGLEVKQGVAALPQEQVAYLQELHRQLEAGKAPVKQITLPARAQEVSVSFDSIPYDGKFLFGTDSRVAAGSFLATKRYLARRGITPAEYIDVRLEERAYYK